MWSVFVRHSITGESDSKLRNKIVPIYESLGLTNHGNTGSWKSDNLNPIDAAAKMAEVLTVFANPLANVTNVNPDAHMDHIWIYIEKTS